MVYHELTGFDLAEVGVENARRLWVQGGFPRAYLDAPAASVRWRQAFARTYLDILAATFMVCVLSPWDENLGKREVKAPKVYLSDSGMLHTGAELDLLVVQKGVRHGFEFKLTDSPRTSASMHSAIKDLKLDSLRVVHAGPHSYPLGESIHALALADVLTLQR